ncbi:MAG TPA: bZIP transcription factor [Pyrinomonadaceae bacterium]|nr:bZIP transcription factor [Pyrinomonadaceae bacterium]
MAFIKRFAPFAIALSIGLFITSLFVDISMPRFGGKHRAKRRQYVEQLEQRNAELERQNAELRSQVESQTGTRNVIVTLPNGDATVTELPVPPIAPVAPIPPVPAVSHKH